MIIKGRARGRSQHLAAHLLRRDQNESVQPFAFVGTVAQDVEGALAELEARGSAGRSKRPLYHASINPSPGYKLSEEQIELSVRALGNKLGLQRQPHVVVLHRKAGRDHIHVVWSRIDVATGHAISDSHNFARHEEAAREMEQAFGHSRVEGAHSDAARAVRPKRRPQEYEYRQEERSGISRHDVSLQLTQLWKISGNGAVFHERLEEAGYILARGDRRAYVVIDRAGNLHSLARRLDGETATTIRRKLQDIEPGDLPSVAAARERFGTSPLRPPPLSQAFLAAKQQVVRRAGRVTPMPRGDQFASTVYRGNAAAMSQPQRSYPEPSIRRETAGDWVRPIPTYRAKRAALLADYANKIAQVRRHAHPDARDAAIEALLAERDAALEALKVAQPIRSSRRGKRKTSPRQPLTGPNGKVTKQTNRTGR